MPSAPFSIVDVFSATAYKGNPLAVVDARGQDLTDTQMKLITRQFNLSETTFFFRPTLPGADFKLRSFLPYGWEVYGAGHNILGVWWHLAHANLLDFSTSTPDNKKRAGGGWSSTAAEVEEEEFTFHQELGGEVIPVKVIRRHRQKKKKERTSETDPTTTNGTTSDNLFTIAIRQASPKSHAVPPDRSAIAAVLGLSASDIGFRSTPKLLPQIMSTSTTHHLLVPVSSVDALNRAVVSRDKLVQQLDLLDSRAHGVFWFTPVAPTAASGSDGSIPTFHARFFSRGMTAEDPATGSAAGPLAAYLYRNGVLPGKLDEEGKKAKILVYQGLKLGRECVIEVRLAVRGGEEEEELEVDIVGGGVEVARGEIGLPALSTTF
ncbi:phenazine biosynthesis PhzF protein [Echria macrotheca]|uniref:Phenazine biosynthesis PhzF protein n=1 Tax=Echria macrotheca TaxID=438768 RepID=A0AAJ0BF82_9PEZI|nr:phenazine biosynthesis PhzF protein [Echria macrotheca]